MNPCRELKQRYHLVRTSSRVQLEEETKRLNKTLSIERGKHRLEVDNVVNKISSLELQIDSLQTAKRREKKHFLLSLPSIKQSRTWPLVRIVSSKATVLRAVSCS